MIDVEMIFAVSPLESQRPGRLAASRQRALVAAVVAGATAVATVLALALALR